MGPNHGLGSETSRWIKRIVGAHKIPKPRFGTGPAHTYGDQFKETMVGPSRGLGSGTSTHLSFRNIIKDPDYSALNRYTESQKEERRQKGEEGKEDERGRGRSQVQ